LGFMSARKPCSAQDSIGNPIDPIVAPYRS
jgi:hypothetical protein